MFEVNQDTKLISMIENDFGEILPIRFTSGKILETDVVIAKNYLSKDELESLELIVSAFLDLAEARAKRNIPMTMEDWSNRLDEFLKLTDREILQDSGKISHKQAVEKAESEYEKYRVIQDQKYISSMDEFYNKYLERW